MRTIFRPNLNTKTAASVSKEHRHNKTVLLWKDGLYIFLKCFSWKPGGSYSLLYKLSTNLEHSSELFNH